MLCDDDDVITPTLVLLAAAALGALLLVRRHQPPVEDATTTTLVPAEPEAPPPAKTRRIDSDVAAAQRRHCVPLVRWMNAVEVRSPLYLVSAQFGADESGVLLPTAKLQVEGAFANLQRALRDGGRTIRDIAKLTVYLVHGRCSLAEYRTVEARYIPRDALPAVTIVYVVALATENILVQIEAVAA
ncbi:hypothetical protein CTAYLR_005243 [Chrysophaeum taylorii]|uniref:RidA family protein n=1 Tax=Chrysophaeum taylorii TaxID=2483200 RepID=A0AAD7UDA8_9STRA|nr:hypothetical protein CTAYLR_005243 [Chrysophaeum taylorii]